MQGVRKGPALGLSSGQAIVDGFLPGRLRLRSRHSNTGLFQEQEPRPGQAPQQKEGDL